MVRSLRERPTRPSQAEAVTPPVRCVYSTAVDGDIATMLGRPHYSYRFAEAKFLAMFAASGRPLQRVAMPEIHATAASLPAAAPSGGLVHLIFRSTEQIRLLKPAINIACYAWEFEVLKDWTGPGEHPFLNQVRMLSLCDEIWVPCAFTRDVLRAHGLTRVQIIPAPISFPSGPMPSRIDALVAIGTVGVMKLRVNVLAPKADIARDVAASGQTLLEFLAPKKPAAGPPIVYLSILNPEDFRKNLDALLRGFHHFQRAVPAARLIVKVLTSADRFPLERVISEVLPKKLAGGDILANDHIVFLNRFLTDSEMTALFALADFYLCASLAEGQNLPLLEAMAHGVVPVTTANTAMADYITQDNAFIIETDRVAAPTEHLAAAIAGKPYQVDLCGARQVHDALMRSAHARPAGRRARSEAAMATARGQYGPDRVWPRVAERLAHAVTATA